MSAEVSHLVTLVRHGESVGNVENRFQGQGDFPLTERGRAQAQALAERWLSEGITFDRCIASPLARARQTAEILCAALNLPLELDSLWMEMNSGQVSGMTEEEARQRLLILLPPFPNPYIHFGGHGESRWELYLRAGKGVQTLVERPPGRYLVVSHGGILNMTLYAMLGIVPQAHLSGARFRFDNTAYATLAYEPQRHTWRLICLRQPLETG